MSTWSQRILKHDHDRNFWSILILGNSVIRTDLPIGSAEHQEFVSFSATTNLIPICYAGKWRRGRKFFDVSSLLVTDYRPDPAQIQTDILVPASAWLPSDLGQTNAYQVVILGPIAL